MSSKWCTAAQLSQYAGRLYSTRTVQVLSTRTQETVPVPVPVARRCISTLDRVVQVLVPGTYTQYVCVQVQVLYRYYSWYSYTVDAFYEYEWQGYAIRVYCTCTAV